MKQFVYGLGTGLISGSLIWAYFHARVRAQLTEVRQRLLADVERAKAKL